MGLIDSVKNLVAKIWAFLEKMVASEVKHLAEQKVKEKVKEKVEDVVVKAKKKASTKAKAVNKAIKKRARTSYGKYIADDPTTTNKNEAYEDK